MDSKLKAVRAGHKSAVKRLLRKTEDDSNLDNEESAELLETLIQKQKIISALDEDIMNSLKEEDIEEEILNADEYKFFLNTKIRHLRKTFANKLCTDNDIPQHDHALPSHTFENINQHSYTHLYSLGNSPINVDEVKKALKNYPHQEVARDLIQGLEAGFKLKYSGPRLPMDIDSKEMNGEKATIARDKILKEINLGSKAIWFVGSSIVYWAQTNAKTRYGGPNIGLQSRGVYIRWFGKRGMLWNDFNAKVSHAVDKFSPPAMIIIQLGSNDLVKVKSLELIQNIERDILRLHLLLPNTRIVWSEMLMRRYWHGATDGKAIERSRKRVNSAINNYALNDGHCVIQHPNIRAREMNLYRYDGTHLSDIGYDIYLNNIQGGIETFLSSQKIRRFPEV
ncbi:unnamed protein product [Mytilus edulis]|uniref:SGNH hydrolase-type esterase domain-containing protein n=1 Tax=Mytilus edulis TaxID=6550 RepID=A0A8S3RPW8_MYTED|nr:unnamed protein product [Mytilus edulis]